MTHEAFPALTLADAEREIHAHIFDRSPEQDHEAKLERVGAALALLGDPHKGLRVVHVTGTNGKTSTSRMIDALLRAAGHRTGLFTSPHLTTLRERIQVDGAPMPQEDLVRLWRRIAPAVHAVDTASLGKGGPRMSFFEVLTVLGLVAFADARVDLAVIEVGIGGARDATNVVDGAVAVLTPMANDHERYLTGGLPGIAREKSGIIKNGAAVVSAAQAEAAAQVVAAAASERRASVFWEGGHLSVEARSVVPGGQSVTLRTAARTYAEVFVPLHGEFQAQNALVALAAAELALGDGVPRSLPDAVVREGFARATSPGRLEVVSHTPLVVADAAHNPHGIAALSTALGEAFGLTRVYGVVAVLADKDADGILAGLDPLLTHAVITRTRSPRATPTRRLASAAREVLGAHRVSEAPDVETALRMAQDMALRDADGGAGVLVAGSITLVAEARRALRSALAGAGAADGAGEPQLA